MRFNSLEPGVVVRISDKSRKDGFDFLALIIRVYKPHEIAIYKCLSGNDTCFFNYDENGQGSFTKDSNYFKNCKIVKDLTYLEKIIYDID